MPKVLMDFLGYIFYFWSNEGDDPPHIHVAKKKQTPHGTKFWIKKDGIKLAHNKGRIKKTDLNKIERYLLANRDVILAEWVMYFQMEKNDQQ